MEMQTAILIFIVIFALAIGFFLGLFLISLDAPFLKKLFLKEGGDESPSRDDEAAADPQQTEVPSLKKPSPGSELVLQVWQEEGKAPVYEAEGKYIAKEDLPKDILNLITIHEQPAQEAAPAPQPPIEPLPEPVQEVVPEEDDEDEEGEIKMLSVVDEVNDILQRKLHGSPLAGKGIHLMENHKQEIRFWVGLESFDDVEDIPDPEIRKLIDDAVKEWEQKRE
jgi:hypothetical protein